MHCDLGLRKAGSQPSQGQPASVSPEYDYSQHGVKTGKNAQLVNQLGLTEYFLDRFAVAGTPSEIVERIRSLARLGLKNLWLSSPGDDPSSLDLIGKEVLPHLNP
jgi:5,10-methylenetetrahydromethanopterin reductase